MHVRNHFSGILSEFWKDLGKIFSLFQEILEEPKRLEVLRKTLVYLYYSREGSANAIQNILKKVDLSKYEDFTMTIAENLIQEGLEKGKLEGKFEAARKMLAEGIALDVILRVTELTEKTLRDHGILK